MIVITKSLININGPRSFLFGSSFLRFQVEKEKVPSEDCHSSWPLLFLRDNKNGLSTRQLTRTNYVRIKGGSSTVHSYCLPALFFFFLIRSKTKKSTTRNWSESSSSSHRTTVLGDIEKWVSQVRDVYELEIALYEARIYIYKLAPNYSGSRGPFFLPTRSFIPSKRIYKFLLFLF